MEFVRTPDARFENLPGYGFAPHYAEVRAKPNSGTPRLRMHYLDEGRLDEGKPDERKAAPASGGASGETVLMLHGEPSWSFLYRKMIPIVTAAGHRVVAPDLIGFGRSDKPTARSDYSYAAHVEWLRELLFDTLDLRDVTLVCQDWGGLLGLRLVGEHPDRFARVVAGNTLLSTGDDPVGPEFEAWLKFSQEAPELPIGGIVGGGTVQPMKPEVQAAYDAPFPDEGYKAGARIFPALVPIRPDDPASPANRAAWAVLEQFERPFLTAFSDGDPLTKRAEPIFQTRIPGAQGMSHVEIKNAGHFLQEDEGEAFARVVVDFIAQT